MNKSEDRPGGPGDKLDMSQLQAQRQRLENEKLELELERQKKNADESPTEILFDSPEPGGQGQNWLWPVALVLLAVVFLFGEDIKNFVKGKVDGGAVVNPDDSAKSPFGLDAVAATVPEASDRSILAALASARADLIESDGLRESPSLKTTTDVGRFSLAASKLRGQSVSTPALGQMLGPAFGKAMGLSPGAAGKPLTDELRRVAVAFNRDLAQQLLK